LCYFQEITKEDKMRCKAYCTAGFYSLKDLQRALKKTKNEVVVFREVLHLFSPSHQGHIFFFDYGCVVFWGFSEKEEKETLTLLKNFEISPLEKIEEDEFEFEPSLTPQTIIKNDVIYLATDNPLDKLAISYGITQSVKLEVFEHRIETTIDQTKYIPETLALEGRIPLSRKKLAKKVGKLFIERNSINIDTEILDLPEFFWEHPEVEHLYIVATKYLDIKPRVELLNRRLDMIRDLFSMLTAEIQHQHSSFLEWIIIVLITVEVLLTVLKDILKVL